MALTYAVGDIIQMRLNFGFVGKVDRFMNVLNYRVKESNNAPPDLPDLLSSLSTSLYDALAPVWAVPASNKARFISVTAQSVFPVPRSAAVTHFPANEKIGNVVGDALPAQDCPTLLKRTAVGTRWGLGRVFVFGLAETGQNEGLMNGQTIQDISAIADIMELNLQLVVGGFNTVLEPVLVRGPIDNPVSVTPILRFEISDEVIKTQRRRRPGKGS